MHLQNMSDTVMIYSLAVCNVLNGHELFREAVV